MHTAFIASVLATAGAIGVGVFMARRQLLALPADYLQTDLKPRGWHQHDHPSRSHVARNTAGIALMVIGVVLLVLPGPGLALFVTGAALCGFSTTTRPVQWVLRRKTILEHVNRLRVRNHRRPFLAGISLDDHVENELPPPHVRS